MSNHNQESTSMQYLPIGASVGISIGMAIGAVTGNIAVGMCIGLSMGMGIGMMIDWTHNEKDDDASAPDTENESEENNE